MIPASVLMKLATLGLDAERAEAVATMLSEVESATRSEAEAVVEKSREKTRVRVQNWRIRQGGNVTERYETLRNGSREPTRVEDNLQTKNSTGQKENKKNTRASDEAAFRADLSTDLPAELLDGVVKLRREKRGQVTALSARLFRDDAAACGMSVSDAAQACVSRNWITVKPEYFRDRQHRGQGPPRNGKRNFADVALDRMNGNGSEGVFGDHGDAQRVSAGQREPGPDDGHLRGGIAGRYLPGRH